MTWIKIVTNVVFFQHRTRGEVTGDLSEEDETMAEEDDRGDGGDMDARKQAEEMYRLLSPLAQIDFEHEVRENRMSKDVREN